MGRSPGSQSQLPRSRTLKILVLAATAPRMVTAAADVPWFKHEYEYDFLEAVLLIILVFCALAFEICWHHIWHEVRHSYHYGELHDEVNRSAEDDEDLPKDSHGNLRHKRLLKELVRRMSGEFMTLGFLALMIFTLNQAEFFDFIATKLDKCNDAHRRLGLAPSAGNATLNSNCWHLPATGSDWLHMAEVVHVKLFLAMIIYFGLVSRVVRRSVYIIKRWEQLRIRRLLEQDGETKPNFDRNYDAYKETREYLIRQVLLWKDSRHKVFKELVSKLNLRRLPREQQMILLRAEIDKRLSLSAYLAYNLEHCVVDSIQVHSTTWFAIIILFVMFATCSRFLKMELIHIVPFIILMGLCFVMIMVMFSTMQKRAIKAFLMSEADDKLDIEGALDDADDVLEVEQAPQRKTTTGAETKAPAVADTRKFYEKYLSTQFVLRALQVVMFFTSYALSDSLADKHKWTERFAPTLTFSLGYLLLCIVLSSILPVQVIVFVRLTSLPPFVNRNNLEVFLNVLIDDHSVESKNKILTVHSTSATQDHLSAALQLAEVIAECRDIESLQYVRQQFLERAEANDCRSAQFTRSVPCAPSWNRTGSRTSRSFLSGTERAKESEIKEAA